MWLTIYYKSWHSQRNQPQVHGGLSNYNHISWIISNAIPNLSNVSKYFKYFKIFQICQNISKYLKYYSRYTAVCQPHKYNMREKSSCARLNLRTLKYRKCLIFWLNYFIVSKHLKGQLWPRVGNVFVYSCPVPLPGQLWPRVSHVFVYSCPAPRPPSKVVMIG